MQNGAAAMETVRYMIARGLGQGEMGIICLMTTECPLGWWKYAELGGHNSFTTLWR